jgi:hypothetical protein
MTNETGILTDAELDAVDDSSDGEKIKTELKEAELSKVSGGVQHKHLAGVKYEDITINCQR